ncbi:MAG: hypothetical protein ACUVT7_00595 [Thermoplasmata archaeon]
MGGRKPASKQVLGRMSELGVEYFGLETLDLASVVRCRVLMRSPLVKSSVLGR